MSDEETIRIMEEYDLDEDDAERVQEIAEEWGIDEDEAVELIDESKKTESELEEDAYNLVLRRHSGDYKYMPTIEQLKNDIESMTWAAMGQKYGVSDNAVRKWAKYYDLL